MRAEIVSIGTELLLGHILNTNAAFLSKKLSEIGVDVFYRTTVGDNPDRLTDAIKCALNRSDIVITSGGLGPTVDDITIETIAKLAAKRLILNSTILKDIKDYFKLRGVTMPRDSIRQAYIPEDVKWIRNRVGTAPGLIVKKDKKTIICLPGPPRELEPMFVYGVMPLIKRSVDKWVLMSRTIKITGMAESQVNQEAKDLLRLKPPTTVGIYAKLGEVDLKIMVKAKNKVKAKSSILNIESKIRKRFGRYIFGYDDETLEGEIGKALTERGLTLAIAESCTGGLISNRMTNISGSSKYFIQGIVTYSNDSKESALGVPADRLKKYGAVSKAVALEMARGIKHYACTDIGVGVTGIAGPTGGTRKKPIGLVYIAFVNDKKKICLETHFKGSREDIKLQASQAALNMIRLNI